MILNRKTIEIYRDKATRIVAEVDMNKERVVFIKESPHTPVDFVGVQVSDLKSLIEKINEMESVKNEN